MTVNKNPFQGLSGTEILLLESDGNRWLEHGPFDNIPSPRQQIDASVRAFQALGDSQTS